MVNSAMKLIAQCLIFLCEMYFGAQFGVCTYILTQTYLILKVPILNCKMRLFALLYFLNFMRQIFHSFKKLLTLLGRAYSYSIA